MGHDGKLGNVSPGVRHAGQGGGHRLGGGGAVKVMLAEKCGGTGGAGSAAQGIAVGAAGAPLNVQHIHAAAGQQGAAAGCVGIGRQGQLTALGPGADCDDKRLIGKAAHQHQRGGVVGGGQRVKAQFHQLGGGVGLGGGSQRTQGVKAAGEQRHDDARRSGGEGKTAKGQHKDHPLGAFSPF